MKKFSALTSVTTPQSMINCIHWSRVDENLSIAGLLSTGGPS